MYNRNDKYKFYICGEKKSHQKRELVCKIKFNRDRSLKQMAVVEIFSYFLIVTSLAKLLGLWGYLAFILGPIIYFMIFNRLFWGTWLKPKV